MDWTKTPWTKRHWAKKLGITQVETDRDGGGLIPLFIP